MAESGWARLGWAGLGWAGPGWVGRNFPVVSPWLTRGHHLGNPGPAAWEWSSPVQIIDFVHILTANTALYLLVLLLYYYKKQSKPHILLLLLDLLDPPDGALLVDVVHHAVGVGGQQVVHLVAQGSLAQQLGALHQVA